MTWFRVDDKLHDHRKARRAGKGPMGVWVLAGTWSMDNDTDGFIPDDVLLRWGSRDDALALVAVGLWQPEERDGESGWRFHDWSHFQPSAAVTAARRAAEAEAGLRGNHTRWHENRGISDPDCGYCHPVPDGEPDQEGDGEPDQGPNRDTRIACESPAIPPVPVPDPYSDLDRSLLAPNPATTPPRPEVDDLCEHLATRIAEDGSRRPAITKAWRTAARLMLDRDGRTPEQIHDAIDWCQNDPFWRTNILSMPKLRDKYDQLRKAAQRGTIPAKGSIDWQAAFARAAERDHQQPEQS